MQTPLAVYIHYPYCVSKCPYCDFNSYGLKRFSADPAELQRSYVAALLGELEFQAASWPLAGRSCSSIFFGGGTPSLLEAASVEKILSALAGKVGFDAGIEITLEANPGTIGEVVGAEKLAAFRLAGINRISLGVQSFRERKLEFLGRIHRSDDSRRAVENVRAAGFTNLNLDLMFAVRGESPDDWASDLRSAFELQPEHISMYGLTIEPGTDFAVQQSRGTVLKAAEELESQMYRDGVRLLSGAGYQRYEISNFARLGRECRHNLSYWSRHEYLGLGAGAHGLRAAGRWGERLYNAPAPHDYIRRASGGAGAVIRREKLTREQAQIEFFMLNLRKSSGFTAADYEALFLQPLSSAALQSLSRLETAELIERRDTAFRLSDRGFLFADSVFEELALCAETSPDEGELSKAI